MTSGSITVFVSVNGICLPAVIVKEFTTLAVLTMKLFTTPRWTTKSLPRGLLSPRKVSMVNDLIKVTCWGYIAFAAINRSILRRLERNSGFLN